MKTKKKRFINRTFPGIKHKSCLLCLVLLLPSFPVTADNYQSVPIYRSAPAPEKLADDLYKPRYRALVINDQVTQQKQENLFAMMINFEFDSIRLLPDSYPLLDSVGQMMNLDNVKDKRVIIEGHTDALGRDEYNQRLSERRALAIKRYLVSRYAVDEKRLVVIGKGESELYDQRKPKNAINRRVQFRPIS